MKKEVIDRVKKLYENSVSIVVINNVLRKPVPNLRGSLRQGDIPSMFWFALGLDPLLSYLERRLQGILLHSLQVEGPNLENLPPLLPPLTQHYKVVSYADDVKPAVTSMNEFVIVEHAWTLLERVSGVKLHRDPSSDKVKFLPLGRWRGTLNQEDLPNQCQYITLSDHLDFVGVQLHATYTKTRKANGDQLVERIKNTINPWKAGKFMALTMRPNSAISFALSKVWCKCSCLSLRLSDISNIVSSIKSWLYQDLLQKPSELVLYRKRTDGGLGLHNVKYRALAILIRAFMETAAHPSFRHSLYHETLFRYHVLGEVSLSNPGFSPYYDKDFFDLIKYYNDCSPLNINVLTLRQWYSLLLEDNILMSDESTSGPRSLLPVRCESIQPDSNWSYTWLLLGTPGLSSDSTSFLFKLVLLLPTQERVHRLGIGNNNTAGLCMLCKSDREDLQHAFYSCPSSAVAGLAALGWAQEIVPGLNQEQSLRLDVREADLSRDEDLALKTILGHSLRYIWEGRLRKKQILLFQVRAELEATVSLLRKSRYVRAGEIVDNIIRDDSR